MAHGVIPILACPKDAAIAPMAAKSPMYVPAAVRNACVACHLEVADMYPAFRSACFIAVALLGIRPRLCLITCEANDGQLGSQTLGAALFRSMHVRFTNIFANYGFSNRNRSVLAPSVKVGA